MCVWGGGGGGGASNKYPQLCVRGASNKYPQLVFLWRNKNKKLHSNCHEIHVCTLSVILEFNFLFQKGKFGIFGHKRSKSETEADSFICPLDLALPLDKLKTSALQYQNKEVLY